MRGVPRRGGGELIGAIGVSGGELTNTANHPGVGVVFGAGALIADRDFVKCVGI